MSNKSPKERLRLLLNSDEAYDLFGTQAEIEAGLEEACKDFLLSRDYKVVDPLSNDLNVRKVQDLCDRFYALSNRKYAGKLPSMSRGKSFDLVIMKHFINSRTKNGVTRKVALLECAKIMETVFMYSEKIGIDGPITIGMFDPGLFSWLIDKALLVINKKLDLEADKFADDICDKICDFGVDNNYWAMFNDEEIE